ncbi:ATP-dependent DNA helicase RecQ [Alishewanella longhuensis]
MIHFGLLQQDITQHSVLRLLPAARPILRGEQQLMLAVPRLQTSQKANSKPSQQQYDRALFARLRSLRKALSERDDVPPFVVFSDATLIDMCQKLPTDNAAMLAVWCGLHQTKPLW